LLSESGDKASRYPASGGQNTSHTEMADRDQHRSGVEGLEELLVNVA
jgi:hypothetical protein